MTKFEWNEHTFTCNHFDSFDSLNIASELHQSYKSASWHSTKLHTPILREKLKLHELSKKPSTTNNIDGTRSHYTLSLSPVLSFVLNGNRWKINSVSQHIFQLLKFIISSLNVVDGFDNTQYGYRMTSTHRYCYVANSKLWINGKKHLLTKS